MEEKYRAELSSFMARTGGDVHAVLLVRKDGLPVSAVAPGVNVKLISAISALVMGALRRIGDELKSGAFKVSIISYESRTLLIHPARDIYIVALMSPETNLGLVLLEVEKLARRLQELL